MSAPSSPRPLAGLAAAALAVGTDRCSADGVRGADAPRPHSDEVSAASHRTPTPTTKSRAPGGAG